MCCLLSTTMPMSIVAPDQWLQGTSAVVDDTIFDCVQHCARSTHVWGKRRCGMSVFVAGTLI